MSGRFKPHWYMRGRASRTKHTGLMTDFIADWYLGYKDAFVGAQSGPIAPMLGMASVGDTNFNSCEHHGTSQERYGTYLADFQFVRGGGGYTQPSHFRVTSQHVAQQYIR